MLRNALSKVLTGKTLDEIAADEAEAKRKALEEIKKREDAERIEKEAKALTFADKKREEGWNVVVTSSEGIKTDLEAQKRLGESEKQIRQDNIEAWNQHKLEINTKKFGYVYIIYYKITG